MFHLVPLYHLYRWCWGLGEIHSRPTMVLVLCIFKCLVLDYCLRYIFSWILMYADHRLIHNWHLACVYMQLEFGISDWYKQHQQLLLYTLRRISMDRTLVVQRFWKVIVFYHFAVGTRLHLFTEFNLGFHLYDLYRWCWLAILLGSGERSIADHCVWFSY